MAFAVHAGPLYDQALSAYWREDNAAAFEKCVAVLESHPSDADAAHARYLMETICTTKLSGMNTQTVARLQQTWQATLYDAFSQATNKNERERLAQKLSGMWRDSTLRDEVKEKLAQEQFHVVMRQLPGRDYPSWEANADFSFPFPDIWTDFTPTLYVNGEVRWAPGSPQLSRSMSVSGSTPLTSMSGGTFKNGDELQCKIVLRQAKKWETTLWTNKITLEKMRQ